MDILNYILKAYLVQLYLDKQYLIIYYIQKIILIELNYNIYNKELLNIVTVFKK